MPTDRSLWVEDKYALRCRGCGERFTMFRRRHHCRRCGQVFCYECLYNNSNNSVQANGASERLINNIYDCFAPFSTRAACPRLDSGSRTATSSPIPVPSIIANEDVRSELSTRLCHRCAVTILGNAERESLSASRADFHSLTNSRNSIYRVPTSHMLLSPSLSQAAAGDGATTSATTPPSAPLTDIPFVSPFTLAVTPIVNVSPLSKSNERNLTLKRSKSCIIEDAQPWRAVRHKETAEEREVTYSVERVLHRIQATMEEWWVAHQAKMKAKEQRKLSASGGNDNDALFGVRTPGSIVHVLSDPISFTVSFCLREKQKDTHNASNNVVDKSSNCVNDGSAASHEGTELTDEEVNFLTTYSTSCTAHILSRLVDTIEAVLPGSDSAVQLSKHLAAIAWHVVQHTAVALGVTVNEHVTIFSVPCPALPVQCVVYPGLICPQRLPSKRAMTACERPRVLLLAGHISYPVQPAEDLVEYVHSYSGYLDKLFQRLVVWNPDVIVVEGGMHHYLRERIEAESNSMRLLLHAGRDFLVQLAWCLQASIIADLQYVGVTDLTTTSPMGECMQFEVLELAEEQRFCAFTGFKDICFHTLVFRGDYLVANGNTTATTVSRTTDRVQNKRMAEDNLDQNSVNEQHQWSALEQLTKEALTAAYHVAMQSHWVLTLLRSSAGVSAFSAEVASAVTTAEVATTACLTLNCGCQYPPEVPSVCQSAGASISLVRDTIVMNVVLMDHLFESTSGNNSDNNKGGVGTNGFKNAMSVVSASLTAPVTATTSLTKARSSDLEMGALVPPSRPFSTGPFRSDFAGLLLIPGLGSSALAQQQRQPQQPTTRHESTAAVAAAASQSYAVVQQKVVMAFYGGGDDSLHAFLLSRCTSTESEVLYLHGSHRVRVRTLRGAPRMSTPGSNSGIFAGSPNGNNQVSGRGAASRPVSDPALQEAQKAAFLLAAMRRSATRALHPGESTDEAATNAWQAFLHGYFSLRISSEAAGTGPGNTAAPAAASSPPSSASPSPLVDVTVPICTAHLMNLSTAAFLEWVLYGWMPLLCTASAQQQQRLRLVFTFHPDAAVTANSTTAFGPPAVCTFYKDTVTLVVDRISILRIQYPPPMLIAPPRDSTTDWLGNLSTVDTWYAAHDAEELEKILSSFFLSLKRILDSLPPSVQPTANHGDRLQESSTSQEHQQSSVATNEQTALLCQLCNRARQAVEALGESRRRSEAEVALFLRSLRRQLIPTLMADYCAWQAEACATQSVKPRPASPATTAPTRDRLDAATAAAKLNGSMDRGVLGNLEDCYYHPDHGQWIRLGEPASALAVALELMYGGVQMVPPATLSNSVMANDSRTFQDRASFSRATPATKAAATPQAPPSSHVSFAVAVDTSLVSNPPSSFTAALNSSFIPTAGLNAQLLSSATLTRDEALENLLLWDKVDASRPASFACSLRGYQPVVPVSPGTGSGGSSGGSDISGSLGKNGASTVSATSASAITSLGGEGTNGTSGSTSGNIISGVNSCCSASSELKVTVEVLFPHAFAALHALYTDGAPLKFAAALLRSRPYTAEGGKSHSRFFVTEDGRFLVKYVKPIELRYFKEWAPRYFKSMANYYTASSSQTLFSEKSTLGKVLGLYVVHVQNSRNRSTLFTLAADAALQAQQQQKPQQSMPHNVLPDGAHCFMVAEQLLFQRPVRETWDLKGSQRNRTTEQTAAVRLDVDLVQERLRHGDFFFCTPEAKSLLMDQLAGDTQMLSDSGIMDYSLMASIGDGNLYVGMIDFLHPYSPAKVLESKMKSGLDTMFGYGRRDPTIIDPSSYAARFMLWMNGYFNGVPDRLFPLTRAQLLAERKENASTTATDAVFGNGRA